MKINENVTLKEEFETFQLINYYSKKEYIQQQKIPSIAFNAVKDEKLFDLVKIETEKNKKKILLR